MKIKFNQRLRELREEKELKQIDIAKVLNVGKGAISQWERGNREPDFTVLVELAKFFNVTTDYMLGVEDYL